MNYTTKQEVQNYLKRNIDAAFDTQLTTYIEAMSRYADNFCGQTLVAETETTRLYDGNNRNELPIDDVHDITAVTIDGTTVTPFQYPANRSRKNLLTFRYDYFIAGNQNVAVTGKFGRLTALPADLKFAVTVLVAGIMNQVDKQTDGIKSEKVGEYQVVYKDDKERTDYLMAMGILKNYQTIAF